MMKSNINQFLKDTDKAIKAERAKQESKAREIVLTAHDMIINASPVDTGYFRANNFLTVNKSTDLTLADGKDDYFKDVQKTVNEAQRNIKGIKFNSTFNITIQNNTKYADRLEGGHSKQAVAGIYGITEQKIKAMLNFKIK